jgi:hypothetical protein
MSFKISRKDTSIFENRETKYDIFITFALIKLYINKNETEIQYQI